jgi:hypothetical protein
VKALLRMGAAILALSGVSLADTNSEQSPVRHYKVEERTVFITGSLIPHRIQVRRVGTTTFSPVRIIDRQEIDQTGRHTTPGALIDEPSVRVLGH